MFSIEKLSADQQSFDVSELIEFVPEDSEFEQYEYIEEQFEEETVLLAEEEEHQQFEEYQNIEETTEQLHAVKFEPVGSDNALFIIKSETDACYHDYKENKFKCQNKTCKRDGSAVFDSPEELNEHNREHLAQLSANQCPLCDKTMTSFQKLCAHMEARHVLKIFTCDNCGKLFRSKDNLRLHMSHHRKFFMVECRACKKTYKSIQSLRYHLRQHFEHHQCETCGQVFDYKKLLLGHIAAKHQKELMVQCRYCSRKFPRNDVREAHERDIHKNGLVGSHFRCQDCDESFDLREELMTHRILHHFNGTIHTCEQCGKYFRKKSLLELHKHSHQEKSFQCGMCKMMFTFNTGLAKHIKLGRCKGPPSLDANTKFNKEQLGRIAKEQLAEITVNPKMPLEFDVFGGGGKEDVKPKKKAVRKRKYGISSVCIKEEPEFSDKKSIVFELPSSSRSGRVIKRKLPQEIPEVPAKLKQVSLYDCDICGMAMGSKPRLTTHMMSSHYEDSNFHCRECGRGFDEVNELKSHAMTHKAVERYKFETFSSEHIENEYPENEKEGKPKRFDCSECPKKYISANLLWQHKLSHENLKLQKCDFCAFSTNAPSDLKNHIKRIHQASKEFECTEEGCTKAFKRRCDMENHRKSVHTNFKVYVKCPSCDVIVLEKGLQSHMINRHSEKANYKPFVCVHCGKRERYEKNLQRHYESVHDPKDRGVVYPCPECSQTFFRRRDLNAHSFEHWKGTIHTCSDCGNQYKTRKELTNHVYSHQRKEWPCHICNQIFQTKSGRSKHISKHGREPTYVPANPTLEVEYEQEIYID